MAAKEMAAPITAAATNSLLEIHAFDFQHDAKVHNSGESAKFSREKIVELLEQIEAIEIKNVADEQEPPALFNINGVEVLPVNAVGIIAAQKKSGKSNFAGLLMSACASPDHQILGGAIRSNLGALKVLNIDTEQPLRDARRTLRRVMKTAGYDYGEQWDAHDIVSISVKDLNEEDRVIITELAIKKFSPQIVFIDGIADLISSINDEAQAKEVMAWMDYLACTYDCAVVGMLHLNYNSGKIGGWAGTQANKKFSDSFLLRKDSPRGFFTVEHEGRGESAPALQFKITCPYGDRTGWYEGIDTPIEELTKEDAEELAERKFLCAAPLPCSNAELVPWVMRAKKWTSRNKAEKYLRKCKKLDILGSRKDGRCSVWYAVNGDADEAQLDFKS